MPDPGGGIAIGLLTGTIKSLFPGGQITLTGSIVSVNASTGTIVVSVNGQQDTIINVPANMIQLLQNQVGKAYSVEVTPNSDGTFSIVSGSNFVQITTRARPPPIIRRQSLQATHRHPLPSNLAP